MKLEQLNLLDILNDYGVSLEKRGMEYWSSCPFHEDSKPSFSVSQTDTGYVWYCFSCKKGGGPIDFVSEYEKIPKPLAKRKLCVDYDIELNIDPDKVLLTEIVEFLHTTEIPYLLNRGIDKSTIEKYKIGYCEDFNSVLNNFEIDEQKAYEIGLFDISRCVIYPFFDFEGCFKISARSIDEKQYISSPKGKLWKYHLWGIEHIKSDKLYLFEGFHDVMVASQYGILSVALSGTNMPDEYWNQLKNYGIKDLIFVPDGDYGGRSFLEKLIEKYDNSFNISVVDLINGDPDDSIMGGSFKDWKHTTILEWYTEHKWGPTNLSEKIQMYKDISRFYCKMNKWEQSLYKSYFSERFGDEGLDYLVPEIKPDVKGERIVIANAIYSDTIKIETLQTLNIDDFHMKIYKNIYEFMKQNTVSPVLIEKNFGVDFSNSVDLINYNRYISEIKNISIKLKLYDELLLSQAKINISDPSDIVGNLSNKMISIVDNRDYIYDTSDLVKNTVNEITERVENPDVLGVPLNEDQFPTLNRSLLGFVPKKLIYILGPTGHGKTTLALNFVDDLIMEKNEKVLFFSLEMTPPEIIEKQIAYSVGISSTKLLTGSLEQSEYDAVIDKAKKLINANLKIIYGCYDLYKIINIAKALILKGKYTKIFIDYVQLITINSKKERWQQLMDITSEIKRQICNDMGATCVLLSQLGKSSLNKSQAGVEDISGSYGMLADADVAITVRQKSGKEIKDGSNFEILVGKHRYGRDNVLIPAIFDKGIQKISESD